MIQLATVSRVTVIADRSLENRILDCCWKLGIKGYSRTECEGKGEHEVVEDIYHGLSLIRIEMIVQPAVGLAILEYLHRPEFENHALTVCIENVQVAATDSF